MGIQLNGITGDAIIPGDVGIGGTLTYEDVANVDSIGVITARDGIRCTGIVTATAFHGDGANLTGVSGFSTALGNTQGTLENLIFKTTESFTVGAEHQSELNQIICLVIQHSQDWVVSMFQQVQPFMYLLELHLL